MTDSPAMLLWTDAYLGDTGHLTTLEHGAYLLILMAMWRAGGKLPNDQRKLATTARLTLDKWRHVAPTIMSLLTIDGTYVTQKRLLQEWKIRLCKHEKSVAAGVLGGRAKYLKSLNLTPSDANVLLKQTPSKTLATQIPESEKKEKTLFADAQRETRARFARFWSAWPHKVEKVQAEKCFAKVEGEIDAILTGVERYIRDKPPDRPWLNPSTFLNNRRWEDAPGATTGAKANGSGKGSMADVAKERLKRFDEARQEQMRSRDSDSSGGSVVRLLPVIRGE